MSHKYTLGQGVVFSPGPGEIVRGNARGKVTRLLPKEDASYQYCIQLEVEDQVRIPTKPAGDSDPNQPPVPGSSAILVQRDRTWRGQVPDVAGTTEV